jgi:hypothetical protein
VLLFGLSVNAFSGALSNMVSMLLENDIWANFGQEKEQDWYERAVKDDLGEKDPGPEVSIPSRRVPQM